MAEGAVTFLLIKLSELFEEEGKLLRNVQKEAEYISDELEFMKAFLRAADAMEERNDQLKLLVKKVKDVTYDIEDALDYFKLHIAHDSAHATLQNVSYSFTNLKARHQIASKMQRIKSRVVSISEQHRRYLIEHNIVEQGSSSTGATLLSRRSDALLRDEADIVGLETPKRELKGWLLGGKYEREVVAVAGTGGLGKSTLAKKVYEDADVKKRFKFRAWITLTQSFKTEDLLMDIIQKLFGALRKPEPQEVYSMDNDNLRTEINKFLRQRRYLVVLDDVWHVHAWDAFENALPNNNYGSRIMLTTRNTEVASVACQEFPDKVYTLNPLSSEETLLLFCKKIFKKNSCPPHLKTVSRKILQKCEGLPLAIVAISGVLATKDKRSVDEWDMVDRCLGAGLEDNDKLKSMTKILLLSYTDLPYYLKSCLLYFSVFPKGYWIEQRKLIRLWIAEGFVKEKEGMC